MSQPRPNILLLSGYHAASHRYWCEQLVGGLTEFNWTLITLPDRHFYWRIRSNALSFTYQYPKLNSQNFDLLVATSMVDVCNLRGLLPHLSRVPAVLYFHENQFAYPERNSGQPERKQNNNLINAQLTTVYSALAADKLVFNSEHNRDTFFSGARALFEKMPDGTPKDLLDHLPDQSQVIPVPVSGDLSERSNTNDKATHKKLRSRPVEIVWNHRWEYDKQPQVFFAVINKLIEDGYELIVHVMGQSFREVPTCFTDFRNDNNEVVATWGHQPVDVYRQVLERSDIVVSAALHDFQGLGMLEAIAAGCIPVAPDRMAYPEYIPEELLYLPGSVEDQEKEDEQREIQEVLALHRKLVQVIEGKFKDNVLKDIDIKRYTCSEVLPAYRRFFTDLMA